MLATQSCMAFDPVSRFVRGEHAHRIGIPDGQRPGADGVLVDFVKEVRLGARGVFRTDRDDLEILLGIVDRPAGGVDDLGFTHLVLVLAMQRAGPDEEGEGPFERGDLGEGFGGQVDVGFHRARQGGQRGALDRFGDALHALEFVLAGGWKSAIDGMDARVGQGLGDGDFLRGGQPDAGHLGAVAQGGVGDEHQGFFLLLTKDEAFDLAIDAR
jgi:hypothetical protein